MEAEDKENLDVQFIFNEEGKKKYAVLPIEFFEALIAGEQDEYGDRWLAAAVNNSAFKSIFEEKDIYTLEDGKPFCG